MECFTLLSLEFPTQDPSPAEPGSKRKGTPGRGMVQAQSKRMFRTRVRGRCCVTWNHMVCVSRSATYQLCDCNPSNLSCTICKWG